MSNNTKAIALEKALTNLRMRWDNKPIFVHDFFGVAGFYDVDVVELATLFFMKVKEDLTQG